MVFSVFKIHCFFRYRTVPALTRRLCGVIVLVSNTEDYSCRRVTVQTVPCTSLHGIGADEVMVSGHLPLAVGDFKWADAVTVHTRKVCAVTII